MAHDMLIDKKEPEGSDDSMNSPEAEALEPLQDTAVAQKKRKGGRKPVYPYSALPYLATLLMILQMYATSEERKQRNRQAQAAFRERRTEYIKQLEETIRVHEANLHNLQTTHRITADECLMLRYKNSLLERILLEKGNPTSVLNIVENYLLILPIGIDVQAELGTKNSIPKLVPTDVLRDMPARRPQPRIKPKAELGASPQSPQSHPTPSFQASLPTLKSSYFNQTRITMPPASDFPAPALSTAEAIEKELGCNGTNGTPVATTEHPSPSQGHMGVNSWVESKATPVGGNYKQLGKLTRPLLSYFFERAID
jgi:hypothetical protein